MRSLMISAALAIAVTPLAAFATAQAPAGYGAATAGTSGAHHARRTRPHRPYVDVPYARQGGWVPYHLRGFEDPGYAYHGNINGCAEDLGYGRWEPCSRGR